jgi:hypothetical protein
MIAKADRPAATPPRSRRAHVRKPAPDIDRLPNTALITREQLAALTGLSVETFKAWGYGREGRGWAAGQAKGPIVIRIEGLPRYRVGDVKAWLGGASAK